MATPLDILIIEDSQDDAELMIAQLRQDGFAPTWRRVETEPDFLAALKKLPDIILSDYSLPQFSGLRAVELLQASGLNIPLILLSGTIGEEAAVDAMKQGATDYLPKDRVARLGNAVERALRDKRLREERKNTEAELLWKTTLLEAQLNSSLDGILVVNSQGKVLLQNRRMNELWKVPQTNGAGQPDVAQLVLDPDKEKKPRQFVEKVTYLNTHPDEAGHDVIELLDGTVLDRYSAPVRDTAGKNYGRIWSFRDITERRKLEAQFRQAQKMESIGQLAGGIAHDFNNILSAIMGNVYLAKLAANEAPALLEPLEHISKAARRATDLVNQILTFSRQNKPEREPVKLNHIVLEALKLLRASLPVSIDIQTDLTADTPAVLANATAVHQIIMNLGTNAWHAMRDKPGTLKVELNIVDVDTHYVISHPDLRPGAYVQLSVSDTGSGMERAVLERIFDPFFTTKPVGEGTGLGLSVVHGIMKSHDGGVYVYSRPGEGTVFRLYFPIIELKVLPQNIETDSIPRGQQERILFVDDEEALATIGKKILDGLGYQVTIMTNPMEALAAVRDQPDQFDLIITDLTMPAIDGLKLGSQLLHIQPGLPIILMTGYSSIMTPEKVQELGFRDFLNKPYTGRILGETVHRVLHPVT